MTVLTVHADGSGGTDATGNEPTPPSFTHLPGYYDAPISLGLWHPDPDAVIYYTLDGSPPDENATVFIGHITLSDPSARKDNFSLIPANAITDDPFRAWREPDGPVRKAQIVRALAHTEAGFSETVTATFFIFEDGHRYPLPVVSLVTDSLNFFGADEGIYVPGNSFKEGRHHTGNYYYRGNEWERPVHIDMIESDGSIALRQKVGARIHGGFTRRFPQKSLRLYARSAYGEDRFNYPIFPDMDYESYNRLLLRNSGNDFAGTMIRDAAAQKLVSHLNIDTQTYRPAILFLNGEFWGIHNFRERYDRHYLERVYHIDPDNLDMLTGRNTADEGDSEHYDNMIAYAINNDLSKQLHFSEMQRRMDMDNYLDYFSAQVYYGNSDWPHSNIDFWRQRIPYNRDAPVGHDGRWRWLLYDADRSLGFSSGVDFDMVEWVMMEYNPVNSSSWPNILFRNLMENKSFHNDFVNKVADHLNTAFQSERVSAVLQEMKAPLTDVMDENINRWPNFGSKAGWADRIQRMHTYAVDRPGYVRNHLQNQFETGEQRDITIDISHPHKGYVYINTTPLIADTPGIKEPVYPWTGAYFEQVPVRLRAVPDYGYRFSHWESKNELPDWVSPQDREIMAYPGDKAHITAHFIPDIEGDKLIHFWFFSNELPNNTPLNMIKPAFSQVSGALLEYEPAVAPYPPALGTEGIMDRVNYPTEVNYPADVPGITFDGTIMRGIRVRNPSLVDGKESAIILHLPTTRYDKPELSFAAVRTGNGQRKLKFEYATEENGTTWTSEGLSRSEATMYEQYKLVTLSFRDIENAANNPDFKVRIRFTGDEDFRAGDNGNVRFNNIALWNNESGFKTVPDRVAPLRPAMRSSGNFLSPDFEWTSSDRALFYIIQITHKSTFDDIKIEYTIEHKDALVSEDGTIMWTLPETLDLDETYYWRVRVVNEAGSTPWSETSRFTTISRLFDRLTLFQNYPNPFNSVTHIDYFLPEPEHVTLEIFDILGRRVAVLIDEEQSHGTNRATLDAAGLSSGMYVYRIRAGGFVETKVMTLVK